MVLEFGGSDEDIAKIGANDTLAKDLAAVIQGRAKVTYESKQVEPSKEDNLLALIVKADPQTIADLRPDSRSIMIGELWRALRSLAYREREIIKLRYGIGDGYAYTLEEVARIFKVTRERVRQVECKTLLKLEHTVRSAPIHEEFKRANSRFGANARHQEEAIKDSTAESVENK